MKINLIVLMSLWSLTLFAASRSKYKETPELDSGYMDTTSTKNSAIKKMPKSHSKWIPDPVLSRNPDQVMDQGPKQQRQEDQGNGSTTNPRIKP